MKDLILDNKAVQALQGELFPGEQLLWAGQCRRWVILYVGRVVGMLVTLPWALGGLICGATLIAQGLTGRVSTAVHLGFPVLGVLLMAVGLYLLAGHILIEAKMRACTFYGVTDQRAIVFRTWPWTTATFYSLDNLPEVHCELRADGSGILSFGESDSRLHPTGGCYVWETPTTRSLERVAGAQQICEVIRSAQRRYYPEVGVKQVMP